MAPAGGERGDAELRRSEEAERMRTSRGGAWPRRRRGGRARPSEVSRGAAARARLRARPFLRHVLWATQEGKWEGEGASARGKRRERGGEEGTFCHVTGAVRPGVSVWRRLR